MQQVTVQEYREAFIDENLPLTTASIHRSVLQAFAKQSKTFRFNLTTRNVFDYLMFNANADKRSQTFGEVSDVVYSDIAQYLGKKERTIENEVLKLVRADLVERHATKRRVFVIPSMLAARDQLIAQGEMKKQMRVTEAAERKIKEMEADGIPMPQRERDWVYAGVAKEVFGGKNGNGNGTHTRDLPFA